MKNYLVNTNDFDLFDNAFDNLFAPAYCGRKNNRLLKTDIKETKTDYVFEIEVPGFNKEDVKLSLKDGYLTVSANKEENKEEDEKYIRRERSFSCSRSYYVGDVDQSTVKAKYDGGVLTVTVPKEQPKVNEDKYIGID